MPRRWRSCRGNSREYFVLIEGTSSGVELGRSLAASFWMDWEAALKPHSS